MSKIPQGEWDAIAARHAQGETIARIAQDYGCTAPAIHYILKRQKQRAKPAAPVAGADTAAPAAAATVMPLNSRPMPELRPAAGVRRASEVHTLELRPTPEPRSASEVRPIAELRPAVEVRPARTNQLQQEEMPAFAVMPAADERHANDSRPERPGDHAQFHARAAHALPQADQARGLEAYPRNLRSPDEGRTENPPIQPAARRGSALKAGLDAELQSQMDEAIETFRSHMHAALTDLSPTGREKLRAAASELMRMAARTMIVLDRLSASHEHNERAAGRAPDYPRSAHAR